MNLKAYHYKQHDVEMYLTALPAKEVCDIAQVDSIDRDADGYQRQPNPKRYKEIRDFVEVARGIVPGGILLNIRPDRAPEVTFQVEDSRDGIEWGTLQLPDKAPFAWMIDGQHRKGGFEACQEVDLPVPVIILVGQEREREAEVFFTVNGKQANVRPSLKCHDLMRYARPEMRKHLEGLEREAHELAYAIVMDLNSTGVWKDKINLSDIRGLKRPATLKGFVNALEPVVKDRWFATLVQAKQKELVQTFWNAMAKVWPSAFMPGNPSVLHRSFGVAVACGLAIDVIHYSDQLGSLSEDTMVSLLDGIKNKVDNWDPEGVVGSFSGGGRKGVSLVLDFLREELRKRFTELTS